MKGEHPRQSLREDIRGHVPYAVIALLLLLSAIGLVIGLETRGEGEIEQDPALTMDRTEAVLESTLRDAVREGATQAAAQPVTTAANNEFGEALTPPGVSPGDGDPDEVFTRYVKLLVYQEAAERVPDAGQELRAGTYTNVSMEPVTDGSSAEDAIDSVTLYVGGDELEYGSGPSENISHGTVKAEIEGIDVELVEDGQTLEDRQMGLNATVATPVFDLHERVNEYEEQLNEDFQGGEEVDGLGDHVARHAYPFMWTRGEAQADGEPIPNVLEERHLEVLTNEGVYDLQEHIFGDADRFEEQSLTRAWGATLPQDYRGAYQSPDGESDDVENVVENVTDDAFLDGSNYIYDDIDVDHLRQELGDEPKFDELAWFNESLNEEHDANLSQQAETSLGELERSNGIDRAIDRVYAVDVEHDLDIDAEASAGDENADFEQLVNLEPTVYDVTSLVDPSHNEPSHEYYEIELTLVGTFIDSDDEAHEILYDVTLVVGGEHGPDSWVESRGIDYDYESGPAGGIGATNLLYDEQREAVPQRAVEVGVPGVTDFDDVENQIEAHIEEEVTTGGKIDPDSFLGEQADFEELLINESAVVDPEPIDREQLRGAIVRDLDGVESELSNVSHVFERSELLEGSSPFEELNDSIASDEEWVYPHAEDTYTNAPGKVRAEARLAYMQYLRDRVAHAIDVHEQQLAELDQEIDGHTASNLADTMNFAEEKLVSYSHPGMYMDEEALTGEISVLPNAEPNYLTLNRVDISSVSATGSPNGGFVPLASEIETVHSHPFDNTAEATIDDVGELLEAGKETDTVAQSGWDDGYLQSLETSLEAEIETLIQESASDAHVRFPAISENDIQNSIATEIQNLGPTEKQAIRLGSSKNTLDQIAANVTEEYSIDEDSEYGYFDEQFKTHLNTSIRYGLRNAIDDGYVGSSTGSQSQELADRVRDQLADSEAELHDERINLAATESLRNTTTTVTGDSWFESNTTSGEYAPNRIPSGVYLPTTPDWDELRLNLWHADLKGEYARFTVHDTNGPMQGNSGMEYVREDETIGFVIDGTERQVGYNEDVSFASTVSVPVAVPSDQLGVGDRTEPDTICSESYSDVGALGSPITSSC